MGIQPTSAYTALSLIANPRQQRQTSADAPADFAASVATLADTVAISQVARDRAAEETKNSGAYDFTNISPNDMLSTINNLIKSGQMSLDESSSLIALIPISLGGGDIPTATHQKMNFFSALENMMAFNKSIHNDAAVIYDQKALSALKRFQVSH